MTVRPSINKTIIGRVFRRRDGFSARGPAGRFENNNKTNSDGHDERVTNIDIEIPWIGYPTTYVITYYFYYYYTHTVYGS